MFSRSHDLADQQPERHAPARRLLERLARRQLAGIRDVRAAGHIQLQLLDLLFDQRARHLERVVAIQRVQHLAAHAVADQIVELALHALAHFGAQRLDAAFLDAERRDELVVDLGQLLLFDLLHVQIELGRLAGQLACWDARPGNATVTVRLSPAWRPSRPASSSGITRLGADDEAARPCRRRPASARRRRVPCSRR